MRSNPSSTDEDRTPTRRRFLRWCGLTATAPLAGCTEDVGTEFPPNEKWPVSELKPALPVRERTELMAELIEETATAEIGDVEAFADAFGEFELEVISVERERDVLMIEYVNMELYSEGNLHGIAPIAGAYAALIDAGYDSVALSIVILDDAPNSFGSATVETTWAEQFNAGDRTAEEYGELVATTVDSKRHPPDVDVSPDE